mmetsp:Transcript_19257/g.42925  ORF Transcript_19257/g.42925 Transcript_19257/m.42925 type:complete len:207 (-) Transcript_19257:45-665(-)
MMWPLATFQSAHSTMPSCALHCRFLRFACTVLIISTFPVPINTWSSSGPQHAQNTELPVLVRQERRLPLLDQILTSPSSPAVRMADPSWLHRIKITAPWCAGTFFSSRPERETKRNVPSVQLSANVSGACLPVAGNHDMQVANTPIGNLPNMSPSAPHLQMTLSSLQERSWPSGDHATAATISVCSCFVVISSLILTGLLLKQTKN